MNDEAGKHDSLDELSEDLRAAVECLKQRPVPEAAMQRALDRAAHCGSLVRSTDPWLRLKAPLRWAAAVAACIAIVAWFWRPSDLWADVVKAVQGKPWIHLTRGGANSGQSPEVWLSTSRGIGGSRSEEQISFFDDRLRIIHRYNLKDHVLYRLPASTESGELVEGQILLEIFQGLFRGDAELKAGFSGMILKDQRRIQTDQGGRKWDEYELHFQIPSRPDADVRMKFVVDPQTRLPHSITTNNGEWNFDYPENGPADIYALGVPKDAKLVDRVPTGDMARVLASIEAGRDRFDDFHAIVIRDLPPDMSPGRGPGRKFPMAFLVWKKGKRWRVEVGMAASLLEEPVPANKDKKEWVREACKKAFFTTANVCDGKAVYGGDMPSDGRERGNFALLATADRSHAYYVGEALRVMPFLWGYPLTFNSPNDRTEETVNLKPSEGPPNTILVTSRLVDLRGHDPANTFKFYRFWLNPMRGYAVVRHDILFSDPAVTPPTDRDQQELMDQWEQTPSGIWYPTRVGTGSLSKGLETGARWYHFFLDFPADMPDELFKPAKRTVLTDRYPVGS
jgi:hypothetical protein